MASSAEAIVMGRAQILGGWRMAVCQRVQALGSAGASPSRHLGGGFFVARQLSLCLIILVPSPARRSWAIRCRSRVITAAVNEFYSGQYRDAERAFRRMARSGVQANKRGGSIRSVITRCSARCSITRAGMPRRSRRSTRRA